MLNKLKINLIKFVLFRFLQDGNFTDYKLWVRSAKEDSFYPLIGKSHAVVNFDH